jgi:hypothetical protein
MQHDLDYLAGPAGDRVAGASGETAGPQQRAGQPGAVSAGDSPSLPAGPAHRVLRLRGGAGEADEADEADIIDDWHVASRAAGRPRSPALQEVDRALGQWKQGGRSDPGNFDQNEHELRGILRAIDHWQAAKQGRSSRRETAIRDLRERIGQELDGVRRRQPDPPVVPGGRDLEIARRLMDPDGTESVRQEILSIDRELAATAQAPGPDARALVQRRERLREDLSILGPMRERTDWALLRPPRSPPWSSPSGAGRPWPSTSARN